MRRYVAFLHDYHWEGEDYLSRVARMTDLTVKSSVFNQTYTGDRKDGKSQTTPSYPYRHVIRLPYTDWEELPTSNETYTKYAEANPFTLT